MKYYKIELQHSGDLKDNTFLHFNSLEDMIETVWHLGCDGFPAVTGGKEITAEEYDEDLDGKTDEDGDFGF